MKLKEELANRWLIYQYSDEKLFDIYDNWWETFYLGIDPSADSLTIGHLVPVMTAVNFMKKWNKFILIVGWATWMIGDPGGKDSERNFLDEKTLRHNEKSLENQLAYILKNLEKLSWEKLDFEVISNYDFYKDLNVLEYLRDAGKYITVNSMMSKETVKERIENPEKSISYTEFSYMILQGYDFFKLFNEKNVKMQIAWSDQWWNAVTGIEMIRKKLDKESFAYTVPLVTDATGKKFWKSEWNAIRVDENRNSPYTVYQYFMNIPDNDVERFLKMLTLMNFEEIQDIVKTHFQEPDKRYWQKQLAKYITKLLFWEKWEKEAIKISEILFGKEDKISILKSFEQKEIKALLKETWWFKTGWTSYKILDLISQVWLVKSKSEWRKMIQSWAIHLNEEKIEDENLEITQKDFINNNILLLRKGKKTYKTVIK